MYVCSKIHSRYSTVLVVGQQVKPKKKYLLRPNIKGSTRESKKGHRRHYSCSYSILSSGEKVELETLIPCSSIIENLPNELLPKSQPALVATGAPKFWPIVLILIIAIILARNQAIYDDDQ